MQLTLFLLSFALQSAGEVLIVKLNTRSLASDGSRSELERAKQGLYAHLAANNIPFTKRHSLENIGVVSIEADAKAKHIVESSLFVRSVHENKNIEQMSGYSPSQENSGILNDNPRLRRRAATSPPEYIENQFSVIGARNLSGLKGEGIKSIPCFN
jgi:hypothetical protein